MYSYSVRIRDYSTCPTPAVVKDVDPLVLVTSLTVISQALVSHKLKLQRHAETAQKYFSEEGDIVYVTAMQGCNARRWRKSCDRSLF